MTPRMRMQLCCFSWLCSAAGHCLGIILALLPTQEEKRSCTQRVEEAVTKKREADNTLQIRMIEYERVAKMLASTQAELRRMREAAAKEGDETAAQVLESHHIRT